MKKSVKVLLVVASVLLAFMIAAIVVWIVKPVKVSMYGDSKYVRVVNAKSTLEDMYNSAESGEFTVFEDSESILTVNVNTTLHPVFDDAAVEKLKKENIFAYYVDLFKDKKVYTWELNDSIKDLRKSVRELNSKRTASTSAAIVDNGDEFELVPEVYGDKIKYGSLSELIKIVVNNGELQVDVKDEDVQKEVNVYVIPRIKAEDLEKPFKRVTNIRNCNIKYINGEVFGWKVLKDYVKIGRRHVGFNDEIITTFANSLSNTYSSLGGSHSFKTHSGQTITVTGGTYGNVMDVDKEIDFLSKAVRRGTVKKGRAPSYTEKSVFGDGVNNVGDTYVEVSIANQHLWFYKDGKLLMQSDVVTGTRGSHDTPVGIYYLSEKVPGEYLIGDDYKTWVDRWMRLTNSGIGLHDATWRSSFGGNIYTYSGSHGCVNLPPTFAKELYDEIEICTPVVVYNQIVSSSNDDSDDDDESEDDSEE